jgi:F420-dependent oxidoreductase-like protein
MRLALMIEGQEGVTWEQWVALARACEQSGIEALFRSDHYISFHRGDREGSLDAWATTVGLAAVTTKLRLGTLVSPATFRHPSELAKVAATADHISGGRIELGLGGGWNEREHEAYGFPFAGMSERLEVFAEQLEIVHRQWTEERFDFEGKHYRLADCTALPKPLQQPRPPIIVGGAAKAGTVRPAARFADEYNTVFCTPEEFATRRGRIRAICAEVGRDPDTLTLSLMTSCALGQKAKERFESSSFPFREAALVGSVDEVAARIREYEDAGCQRIMLQHLQHEDVEMVATIGNELAPLVR